MASAAAIPPAEFPMIRYFASGTVTLAMDADGG
jgi:hypothetical protein